MSRRENRKFKRGVDHTQMLLQKYRGDEYMCRLIFLAAIGNNTLEDFLLKVRNEVQRDVKMAIPTAKAINQAMRVHKNHQARATYNKWAKGE